MLGNHIGVQIGRIATADNVIADRLSRVRHHVDLPTMFPLICQDHEALRGCRQFQPNAELISAIMAALLDHALPHPVGLSRRLLTNPGCFITSPGVSV
jgi:hypothetical protein